MTERITKKEYIIGVIFFIAKKFKNSFNGQYHSFIIDSTIKAIYSHKSKQ